MTQKEKDKLADIVWYIKGQIDFMTLNHDYSAPFDKSHVDALTEAMNNDPKKLIIWKGVAEKYWIHEFITDWDSLNSIALEGGSVYVSGEDRVISASFVSNYQYRRLDRLFKENQIVKVLKK